MPTNYVDQNINPPLLDESRAAGGVAQALADLRSAVRALQAADSGDDAGIAAAQADATQALSDAADAQQAADDAQGDATQALADAAAAQATADAAIPQTDVLTVALTPGAEAADVIAVTGLLKDLAGATVAVATLIEIRTVPATADKGDIAITDGAAGVIVNPATGDNVAFVTCDGDGSFAFTVTDDQVEDVAVIVTPSGGVPKIITLSFAA